jgi:trehalose utilization protein
MIPADIRGGQYFRRRNFLVRRGENAESSIMNTTDSRETISTSQPITRRTALRLGATAAVGVLTQIDLLAQDRKRRVVVWSEGSVNEDPNSESAKVYPDDVNTAIAAGLKTLEGKGWEIVKAGLADPDQGLSDERLEGTEVLIWWGHKKHGQVHDELVDKIAARVKDGKMGFIGTHSAHFSKPLKRILGTPCSWREYVLDGTTVDIIVKEPNHPICKGVENFTIPIERYGEPFAVPEPESVPLDGLYHRPNGKTEPARMGMCWTIGKGRVFYFTPGHETFPDYKRPQVRRIFVNAVQWAAPTQSA